MNGAKKINNQLKLSAAEYRKSLYSANTDVEHFAKMRQIALFTLMALMMLHEITNVALMLQGVASVQYLGQNIAKFVIYMVLLAMPLLGNWKASLGLYVMAIPTLVSFAASWDSIRAINYTELPLLLVLVIIETLFIILLVVVTLWLTVSTKNHRLADRDREIRLDYVRFINERITTTIDI